MQANLDNTIEWKIDSGVIRRIQYTIQTYDGPNTFVGGWLDIEFVTGTCNRYFVSIECVGDLLCSDHPIRCLEQYIAPNCREEYNRTSKLLGHNPDWAPSGFHWIARNALGLSEAIEEVNKSIESQVENREWQAKKHERIKEWIQKIEIFSHEIAEREKSRINADAHLLAAVSEWVKPINWQLDFGFIKRIAYDGWKHFKPNAILPLGRLEIELITGVGYTYPVPIELVSDLLVAADPNGYFEHRIAKEYGQDSLRTVSSPGSDPAYGTTQRFSKNRNSTALDKAIEEAKASVCLPGDNSRWIMGRESRLAQWTVRIAMFSPELAEKEKARALASISQVAHEVAQSELKAAELRALVRSFYVKQDEQTDALVKTTAEHEMPQQKVLSSVTESEHQSTPQAKPCKASELLSQTVENNHVTGPPSKLEEPAILNSSDAAISAKPPTSTSHLKLPKSFRFLEEVWLLWFLVMVIITGYRVFVLEKKDAGLLILVPAIIIICVFCITWIERLFRKPNKAFADESSISFSREIRRNEDIICASPETLTHSDDYERFKPPSTTLPETRQDTGECKETESIDSADVSVEDSNDPADALENLSNEVIDTSREEIHQLYPKPSEQEPYAIEGLGSLDDNLQNVQTEHPVSNSEAAKIGESNERVSLQLLPPAPEIPPPTTAAKLPRQLRLFNLEAATISQQKPHR